jgi:hypothetical protein
MSATGWQEDRIALAHQPIVALTGTSPAGHNSAFRDVKPKM